MGAAGLVLTAERTHPEGDIAEASLHEVLAYAGCRCRCACEDAKDAGRGKESFAMPEEERSQPWLGRDFGPSPRPAADPPVETLTCHFIRFTLSRSTLPLSSNMQICIAGGTS